MITPHNITSRYATGMVVSNFLVEIEKTNPDDLSRRYHRAFEQRYHAVAGLRFGAWAGA